MNEYKIIGFKFWKSKQNLDFVTVYAVYQRRDTTGFASVEAVCRLENVTGGEVKIDAICKLYYGPRGSVGYFVEGIEIIR